MTREEIGSYLGLSLETVSRIFSRFQEDGLVDVQTRHLQITNPEARPEIAAGKIHTRRHRYVQTFTATD